MAQTVNDVESGFISSILRRYSEVYDCTGEIFSSLSGKISLTNNIANKSLNFAAISKLQWRTAGELIAF